MTQNNPEKSALHLIPGISASGKTTIGRWAVNKLVSNGVSAKFVVPHTTRPRREYEKEGVDYYFHTPEEFETFYLPKCTNPDDEWVASEIGNYYYFNTTSATRPDDDHGISVLPVAFSTLPDVIDEHAGASYDITILPLAIGQSLSARWLNIVQPQRVDRDLTAELQMQNEFLDTYQGDVFYPEWNREADSDNYYRCLASMVGLGHILLGKEE